MQPCMAIAHTDYYYDRKDPIPSNRDKTVRFARFLLQNLWQHKELRKPFKKAGWRASHFCVHEPIIRPALKQWAREDHFARSPKRGNETGETRRIGTPVPLGRVNERGELIQEDAEEEEPLPKVSFSLNMSPFAHNIVLRIIIECK